MLRAFGAIFLAALLMLSFAAPAAAGPFEDGIAAYDRGDFATALRLMRPLAEQGYASAQHNVGIIYGDGQGVPQDYAEAMKWFRKAAEQGDVTAQHNLGIMYANGQGVPQDYAEAMRGFRMAADKGNADAQYNLGRLMKETESNARLC